MPAYKDSKTGTWFVKFYCKDWTGENKQIKKRGFATKREALDYERNYKIRQENNLDMTFGEFWKLYTEDVKNYVKLNTWLTKEHIVDTKILPYFKNLKMNEITPGDVRKWQNEMVAFRYENGKSYSQTYKKTMHNILSAIFNHACRFYNLKSNPARQAGNMGREEKKEMLFWTTEEYKKFSEAVIDKPVSFYAFEMLYWTGMRLGDDDDKIRLNQRKPSKYKGLRRFGPKKNLQRINKFMKERPIFYKNLIQMKENIRFYLRCFYCITKVMILQFNSENRTELARNG